MNVAALPSEGSIGSWNHICVYGCTTDPALNLTDAHQSLESTKRQLEETHPTLCAPAFLLRSCTAPIPLNLSTVTEAGRPSS